MEVRTPNPADLDAIADFLTAISQTDAGSILSEHKARNVGASDVLEILAIDEGSLLAYVQAARHAVPAGVYWAIEAATASAAGIDAATAATAAVVTLLPANEDYGFWARRDRDRAIAIELGLVESRLLLQMSRHLPIRDQPQWPEGISPSAFRLDFDEAQWLELNNVAFADHPENGDMSREELSARMEQPWFEPGGIRMAWHEDVLWGSCWTKIEDETGEIYIVAVHPDARGIGLGRALVIDGLRYMASQELDAALLWVEADNRAAIELYESLGFTTADSTSLWKL